jgi:hypothetical protein
MASDEQSAEPVRGEPHAPGQASRPASATVVKGAALMLRAYRSESAIYGVVLVSSLIAIGWRESTDLEVLEFTLGAVIVFWLAHVYAGTVSREETGSPRMRAVLAAARTSAAHSSGMLLAMILPTIFLLLATVNVLDEYVAYYLALWAGTAVLAVIGWFTARRRGGHWGWWLLSALITASLGLLVTWLGSLVH